MRRDYDFLHPLAIGLGQRASAYLTRPPLWQERTLKTAKSHKAAISLAKWVSLRDVGKSAGDLVLPDAENHRGTSDHTAVDS